MPPIGKWKDEKSILQVRQIQPWQARNKFLGSLRQGRQSFELKSTWGCSKQFTHGIGSLQPVDDVRSGLFGFRLECLRAKLENRRCFVVLWHSLEELPGFLGYGKIEQLRWKLLCDKKSPGYSFVQISNKLAMSSHYLIEKLFSISNTNLSVDPVPGENCHHSAIPLSHEEMNNKLKSWGWIKLTDTIIANDFHVEFHYWLYTLNWKRLFVYALLVMQRVSIAL